MGDFGERITRQLTVRYLAVTAVLGLLALASLAAMVRTLSDAAANADAALQAGERQTLEANSALLATRLAAGGAGGAGGVARDQLRNELRQSLDRLADLPSSRGSEAGEFLVLGRAFAARSVPSLDDPDLAALQRLATPPSGPGSGATVSLWRPLAVEGAIVVVTLLLLAISAWGVFRPLAERLRADLAERSRASRSLRDSEERLWRILEESPVGVSASRRTDGRVVFANTRFCDIILADRTEVLGSLARDHFVDEVQRRELIAELKQLGRIDDREVEFRRRDGTPFASLLTVRTTRFEGEDVNLAWIYDISKLKAAEERLKLTAKVVDTASEAVLITDENNCIQFVNPAFTTITEYSAAEVLGKNPSLLSSGRHDADFYRAMWRALRETGRWRGEVWNRRKSGEFFAEQLSIVACRDATGVSAHHIAVFSDITHRKEDEERVWRQANYDALTGLPNRSLFVDRLSQAVRQSRRDDKTFALMFLDLDGFKRVNDTLGHAAGDLLLQQTAARLSTNVRASDTVARLAGDEFTIIMQGVRDRDESARLAAKILESLAEPFDLDGSQAEIRGSIGVALFPDDAGDGSALLKLADRAMYSVKRHGKNNFGFADAPAITP